MNSSWTVEHPCPQCGAPVQLAETDRVLFCGFCRVRHLLMTPGFFHYCLPARVPRDDIFFIPYWHFRGLAFTCANDTVRFRVADISRCASELDYAPLTLGLRPQTMKLRFASQDKDRQAFFVARNGEARDMILSPETWNRVDSLSAREQVWMREFIGETCSVIYAPFYYRNKTLYDAVLDRPVHSIPPDEKPANPRGTRDPGRLIRFVPALCPQCGWDLSGEREACVFTCRNCETSWESTAGSLKPVTCSRAETRDSDVVYVPFWRMQARMEGVELATFADLIRFANLARAMMPAFEHQPLHFWVPAFKIQPSLFLRLMQQLTVLQPDLPESSRMHNVELYPATLPRNEAVESIKVILAALAVNKRHFFPLLESIRTHLTDARLLYLPFRRSGHDYVQSHFGFSLSRRAFHFGRKI